MKLIWVEDGVSVTIGVSLGTHKKHSHGAMVHLKPSHFKRGKPSENIGQVMTLVISAKRTERPKVS